MYVLIKIVLNFCFFQFSDLGVCGCFFLLKNLDQKGIEKCIFFSFCQDLVVCGIRFKLTSIEQWIFPASACI